MPARRTINQQLRKCSTVEGRLRAAHDWIDGWQRETANVLDKLLRGMDEGDWHAVHGAYVQLQAGSGKRLEALHGVVDNLAEPPPANDGAA